MHSVTAYISKLMFFSFIQGRCRTGEPCVDCIRNSSRVLLCQCKYFCSCWTGNLLQMNLFLSTNVAVSVIQ